MTGRLASPSAPPEPGDALVAAAGRMIPSTVGDYDAGRPVMAATRFGRQACRRGVAMVVLAALLLGCTATRPVDLHGTAGLADSVAPHDRVSVTTTDGRELSLEVVAVEPDALVGTDERGEEQRLERAEILSLEVTQFSPTRTAGLAAGTGLSAFLIAGFIVAAIGPALILTAAAP